MPKSELPLGTGLYPVPVVLVSCLDKKDGKANIITIAWCGIVCSEPPLVSVSIRPSRLSHKLINLTRDFVINIPPKGLLKKVDACGIVSGKSTDKFKEFSLTPEPSKKIISPMIKECPVNIECSLKDVVKLGSHDMFIGEVVCVHADSSMIGSGGSIDYDKAAPFSYIQGEYREIGKQIGHYGFSRG